MPTLVYAPAATIRIFSRKMNTIVDVSDDIQNGSVTRIVNGVSTAEFSLLNQSNKYAGVFSPMDRVVIYLRRLKTVLSFSGYLDSVPMWSAVPKSSNYTASCTLKVLQNWLWDPGTFESTALINEGIQAGMLANGDPAYNDGGMAVRTIDLLEQVVGWKRDKIHIGKVPDNWFKRLEPILAEVEEEAAAQYLQFLLSGDSYLGGESPITGTSTSITGIGPGTGTLPDVSGKISAFGGPGGGAYGRMALTGESGTNPLDPWYVAMRWPYVSPTGGKVPGVDVAKAKEWWRDQRILVSSPKTGKSVILRAADWGPHISTGRVIDVSPRALKELGIGTDDVVNIAFANDNKGGPLGPHGVAIGPNVTSQGWGQHGDTSNMVQVTAAGCTFTVHKNAAAKFKGFVEELKSKLGYQPKSIGGFNDRPIAGTSTWSNHAYGAAIDIDPSINPRYASAAGGPYALPKPPAIVDLAKKWGLYWGGLYRNSKDYMHFEVVGAPATDAPDNYSTGPSGNPVVVKWQRPLKDKHTVTARFGEKGGNWANGHSGTDFAAPEGTPIYPVGPGRVLETGTGDESYGNYVTIDHGKQVYTFYAHMVSASTLSVGDVVDQNTVLGKVGETGNVTGPHVHVELRLDENTYNAALTSGGIEKYVLGNSPPPRGVDGFTDIGGLGAGAEVGIGGADLSAIGGGLFNVHQAMLRVASQESMLLTGPRALMNDIPILQTVAEYMTSCFRDFCSAPNGDFIAWFPDYFGHHKQAGKMVISKLEIDAHHNPPVMRWTDEQLKTHQFFTGATNGFMQDAGGIVRRMLTQGYASVEDARLTAALLNISDDEAEEMAETLLPLYGARVETKTGNHVNAGPAEFYFACMEFMRNWSSQYRTSIAVTFMPEIYPGMLACFPDYGLQGYVQAVTHNFDYTGGFTTTLQAAPWSTIGDSGPKGMPKGAPL